MRVIEALGVEPDSHNRGGEIAVRALLHLAAQAILVGVGKAAAHPAKFSPIAPGSDRPQEYSSKSMTIGLVSSSRLQFHPVELKTFNTNTATSRQFMMQPGGDGITLVNGAVGAIDITVPEPASVAVLAAGLISLAVSARPSKRRRASGSEGQTFLAR